MKLLPVMSIRDIDPFVAGDRMRNNRLCRVDTMLPLFLHLGMHHQKRVVRKMYGDLALSIRSKVVVMFTVRSLIFVPRDYLPDSELPRHSQTQTPDHRPWAEIGQLIGMVTHTFSTALVAVHKSSIGRPLLSGLVPQLPPIRIARLDPLRNLLIDRRLHHARNGPHTRRDLPNILSLSISSPLTS